MNAFNALAGWLVIAAVLVVCLSAIVLIGVFVFAARQRRFEREMREADEKLKETSAAHQRCLRRFLISKPWRERL